MNIVFLGIDLAKLRIVILLFGISLSSWWKKRYSSKDQCVKKYSGGVNSDSGQMNTDSGKMNRDSGHGARSWHFHPEYAFTPLQNERSRSTRICVHVSPEYASDEGSFYLNPIYSTKPCRNIKLSCLNINDAPINYCKINILFWCA